jgi:hypothetical protein
MPASWRFAIKAAAGRYLVGLVQLASEDDEHLGLKPVCSFSGPLM